MRWTAPGQQYLDAGYTLAVLYYRLPRSATTTSWLVCSNPYEAVDDVAAANVDANQIVFSGFSAGGHLASLYSSLCGAQIACPTGQVLHFPFMEKGSKIFCSEVGMAFNALEAMMHVFLLLWSMRRPLLHYCIMPA